MQIGPRPVVPRKRATTAIDPAYCYRRDGSVLAGSDRMTRTGRSCLLRLSFVLALFAVVVAPACADRSPTVAGDPLRSWNDGTARKALVDFVTRVTTPGNADFVPVADRIAVFDNDGTLWCEQPLYVQAMFIVDRVKALASAHPEWQTTQPFKGVLEGDAKAAATSGEAGLQQLVAATHAGITTDEFEDVVRTWIASARHPKFNKLYTEMIYQPMLEVLAYLREHEFQTYIVSGGGVDFMRPWTERVYGIPPEHVVGSRAKMRYDVRNGVPVLLRLPDIDLVDDKEGKPVGIQQAIGRRPLAAFGNSDGDFQMLEWTSSRKGPHFAMLVHHTDATREFAYDRGSHVGALARGLDEASARGWVVVDMQKDWRQVFPFEKVQTP
jgi:haloacid dehalogenase-like hydrolase